MKATFCTQGEKCLCALPTGSSEHNIIADFLRHLVSNDRNGHDNTYFDRNQETCCNCRAIADIMERVRYKQARWQSWRCNSPPVMMVTDSQLDKS